MFESQRPLVVRCGAFGDMVLITALIRDLHVKFGRDVDVLTSGPWSEPLLRGQIGVGTVTTIRSRKTPYWLSVAQRRAVKFLRARGVGATWFCDGNDAVRPLLARAGITQDFIVDARDFPLSPGEHATLQWARLAQRVPRAAGFWQMDAVAAARAAGGCKLDVSDAQLADLDRWLRVRRLDGSPLIAIQIGNKRTMRRGLRRRSTNTKYWPYERWAVVLSHVRARFPGHVMLLLGTGPEYGMNEEVRRLAGPQGLVNVADDLPVPRLVALLSYVAGLITVDSGPAHAAAAVGCPLVVLFGKASTSLYRPWGTAGADVAVVTGELQGEPSMLGIQSDAVIAAWDGLRLRQRA